MPQQHHWNRIALVAAALAAPTALVGCQDQADSINASQPGKIPERSDAMLGDGQNQGGSAAANAANAGAAAADNP